MSVLFGLQHLMHRLGHPYMLLHIIFVQLYQNDVISYDSFQSWEKNKDPAEQEGKTEALMSCILFFPWLKKEEGEDDFARFLIPDRKTRLYLLQKGHKFVSICISRVRMPLPEYRSSCLMTFSLGMACLGVVMGSIVSFVFRSVVIHLNTSVPLYSR